MDIIIQALCGTAIWCFLLVLFASGWRVIKEGEYTGFRREPEYIVTGWQASFIGYAYIVGAILMGLSYILRIGVPALGGSKDLANSFAVGGCIFGFSWVLLGNLIMLTNVTLIFPRFCKYSKL